MADAIRLMTVERGIDHRDYALIAFGGAGPLHAVDVAAPLEMKKVVVPPHPGLCSALGTLLTDLRVDRARTVNHRSDTVDLRVLNDQLQALAREAVDELKRDGLEGEARVSGYISMRYAGQNFGELVQLDTLDLDTDGFARALEGLHRQHEELYGYALRDKVAEMTEVRVIAVGEERTDATLSAPASGSGRPPRPPRGLFRGRGAAGDAGLPARRACRRLCGRGACDHRRDGFPPPSCRHGARSRWAPTAASS